MDEREADDRTDEACGRGEEAGEPAGPALIAEHAKMIGTSGTEVERVDEVGAESADLSPAAVAAEAERLRILREVQIRRRG